MDEAQPRLTGERVLRQALPVRAAIGPESLHLRGCAQWKAIRRVNRCRKDPGLPHKGASAVSKTFAGRSLPCPMIVEPSQPSLVKICRTLAATPRFSYALLHRREGEEADHRSKQPPGGEDHSVQTRPTPVISQNRQAHNPDPAKTPHVPRGFRQTRFAAACIFNPRLCGFLYRQFVKGSPARERGTSPTVKEAPHSFAINNLSQTLTVGLAPRIGNLDPLGTLT